MKCTALALATALLFPSIASSSRHQTAAGFDARTQLDLPLLREIDSARADGSLTLEESIAVRDLAVRSPAALEEPWRGLFSVDPLPPAAATAVLIENQQWRLRAGLSSPGASRADYAFPEELPYYLDSGLFPIRVYYSAGQDDLAAGVLEAADISWQKEVVEWGFYAPPLVTPEGRYRLYVGDPGAGAAGYMAPFELYGDVSWTACVSYIVIGDANAASGVGPVVAHEMNHAMQAAMDCLEQLAFFENTATFVMEPVFPGGGLAYQNGVLGSFQSAPEQSICRGDSEALFMYGGFLWPHYLAYAYEDEENGPIFVRRIWEGARQSAYENSPNYMESIDALLRADYGSNLSDAFEDFSIARFFLDDRASQAPVELANAAGFSSNPPSSGTIQVDMAITRTVSEETAPAPFAVNYWKLVAPSGFDREVTIDLAAEEDDPWTLLLFSPGDAEVARAASEGGASQLRYTPQPGEERYLAVVRGSEAAFDPDSLYTSASYTLTAGPTVPSPEIDTLTPNTIGDAQTADLEILGAYFQQGATVAFSPDGVSVDSATFVDDTRLDIAVTVNADAVSGYYSLTVTNPDGGSDTIYSVLRIEEPAVEQIPASGGEGDCACGAAGRSFDGAGPLAFLF